MAKFRAAKVVSALPDPLAPNTIYLVRTGAGFDLYCSDSTGSIAHKNNAVTAAELGTAASRNIGTSGANVPLLNAANTWAAGQTFSLPASAKVVHFGAGGYFNAGNSGSAKTIDFANGQKQVVTLTANCTLTLTAPGPGNYQILLAQDATGGRSVTWAAQGGIVVFVGSAAAPAINTSVNGYTMVSLFFDGVTNGNAWLAAAKVNA